LHRRGLLVGLLVGQPETGTRSPRSCEFKTGRFDYRNAPGIVITAIVSLIPAGPGRKRPSRRLRWNRTWLGDRFKLKEHESRAMGYSGFSGMLAAFITSPFSGALLTLESAQGGASAGGMYLWGFVPSLLASATATVVFVGLTGRFFETLYAFPDYMPHLIDLLWAVPFGLAGSLIGVFFMLGLRWLRQLMQPLKTHLVWRGLIGGLVMGIIGALLPLIRFSGEAETLELIDQAAQMGFLTLVVLAVSKLFATALLLATGWKGGYIFPVMFAGIAIGMAGKVLFPGVPTAVPVAAVLAGALAAAFRAPLFAALFTLTMVQAETAPVVTVAVLIGFILSVRRATAGAALRLPRRHLPYRKPLSYKDKDGGTRCPLLLSLSRNRSQSPWSGSCRSLCGCLPIKPPGWAPT
jgi:H+/Cl- antiporter ClcA